MEALIKQKIKSFTSHFDTSLSRFTSNTIHKQHGWASLKLCWTIHEKKKKKKNAPTTNSYSKWIDVIPMSIILEIG